METVPSTDVKPPRVATEYVAMEYRVTQIIPVEGTTNIMVLGIILRFHIREDFLRKNSTVDTIRMKPITRHNTAEWCG